jgi:hypothetical protein
LNGIQEVTGSIPVSSTRNPAPAGFRISGGRAPGAGLRLRKRGRRPGGWQHRQRSHASHERPFARGRPRERVRRGDQPVFNGNVGRAFQRWALAAFPGRSLPENTQTLRSELRERLTRLRVGGPILGVRPDAIGGAVTLAWAGFPAMTVAPREVHARGSVFVEVKAIRGALTMSHSVHQISGLIDVAANSIAARMMDLDRPTPAVIFITTQDTSISPSLLTEATGRGVAIWQAVVFELRGSTTNQPRFGVGPVVPRNPE